MRFAVRRPGIPEASPRSHGVPRRDIPGRVHISVAGISAGRAREPRLALTRLRIHLPARRAALARELGTDLLHPAGRLVLQPAHQQAPARPHDLPVQPGLGPHVPARIPGRPPTRPGHVTDLQVLDADHIEAPRDVRAGLLGPVLAPVRLMGTQPGDGVLDPAATVRPAPGPGQLALQAPYAPLFPSGQAGGVQQFPGRQRRTDGNPAVDAHGLAVTRCGNRLGDHGEGDMPASGAVHLHPVGLHARRHNAGPAEPHPPGLRYPDLPDMAAKPTHLLGLDGDDPESFIPPGLTPARPVGRVMRVEERHHRPGEVPQGLLLHHLGALSQPRILGAGGGELLALLQIARSACLARVPVSVLLDGQIPYIPGVAAVPPQHALLGGGGKQPVPGHTNILSTTTDISGEVKRRLLPGLKAGVSTPPSL